MCWSWGSKHAHSANQNAANSIPPPAETPKSLSLKEQPALRLQRGGGEGPITLHSSHCKFTGLLSRFNRVRLGERNTTHKFAQSVIQGGEKKIHTRLQDLRAPLSYSTEKTKTHTYTHKEWRETWSHLQLYSFIMFPDSNLGPGCAKRKHTEGVAVTAEKQPKTSNVHVIKAGHCSFWVILKHQRNPSVPSDLSLTGIKLSPDTPVNGANSPGVSWDRGMSHHCLHPWDVPIWTHPVLSALPTHLQLFHNF